VAVRTEEPKIACSVVEEIAVDVVDVESEWSTVPFLAHPTHGASFWYSDGEACPMQQHTFSSPLAIGPCYQDELGFDLLRIVFPLL
jgi:hypothetical protein